MQDRLLNNLIKITWVGIAAYVFSRAFIVDITHDEAYSFFNIKKFWHVQFLCNANSHWLNSLGMKCASMLGAETAGPLRWLSLLSFLGFSAAGLYWIKSLKEIPLKLFAFAFLFLNPFVLDYFSLARGYASALGLETLSLLFFSVAITKEDRKLALISLLCAGLSAIANFNFFYFFLAFASVYYYRFYLSNGISFLKKRNFYIDAVITIGFILMVLRALLFIRRCSNDFEFGSDSFIASVFTGFLHSLLYEKNNEEVNGLYIPAVLLCILVFSAALYDVWKYKTQQNKIHFISSVILILIFCAVVFNHYAFSTPYPYYRTALPLFPLMAVCLVGLISSIPNTNMKNSILILLSVTLLINFCLKINFKYTFDFYHQCESKDCFDLAQKNKAAKVGISPEHYGVFINYYQATDKHKYSFYGERINTYNPRPTWMETTRLKDFDHLVLFPPYNLKFYKDRKVKFEAVKFFPITGSLLIKVKRME